MHAQKTHVLLDKRVILIGEHIKYNLRVTVPVNGYNMLVKVPHDLQNFEVLDLGVSKAGEQSMEQTITLTSFDSGAWLIPPFEVVLTKGNDVLRVNTPGVQVRVNYQLDEPANLHDIKSVFSPGRKINWLYLLATILLVCVVVYLLMRHFKKRVEPVPRLDPQAAYFEAMQALTELRKVQSDPKKFHLGVSDTLKKYLYQCTGTPMAQRTTDEVLIWLKSFSNEDLTEAAAVLRLGDAVKFAKFLPEDRLQADTQLKIQSLIERLHKKQ